VTRSAAVAGLFAAWLALTAATPLPLAPQPMDVTALVPFVSAPLDKPSITLPAVTMPSVPLDVLPIPAAVVVRPTTDRPAATMPPPRTLPCFGAWTGVVGEALECGRARLLRGDLQEAVQALDQAVRNGREREIVAEARYWLGETLYRLGRIEQADAEFRQVTPERSLALAPFALHSSGWIALMLGDAGRARDAFAKLLASTRPLAIDAWGRFGLGLSLTALGHHAEAQRAWADVLSRRPPPALERDALFWHGDALGRIGEPERAMIDLARFTQGGPHPLLAAGLVRLAWWSLAARRPAESLTAVRAYPGPRMQEPRSEANRHQEAADRDWVDGSLALALLASGDLGGARTAAQPLGARRSPLALPIQLRLAAASLARRDTAAVDAVLAELMRGTLTPPVRAWVLMVKGEAALSESKSDDARTQFDLVRGIDAHTEVGRYATLRLAQINLEMREFKQAVVDVAPLVSVPGDRAMRTAVLLLHGEAAYRAGDYQTSARAFERMIAEVPERPEVRAAHLGLAWTALREGRAPQAGQRFAEFARLYPDDEPATDALVLASEMAIASGDLRTARELFDRVLARAPRAPRAEFARLNRGILMVRSGEAAAAVPLLSDWTARAPFPPLLGRAQTALAIALLTAGRAGDAGREFAAARREGEGALASLGLAIVALAEGKLPEAAREFTEARNDGTAAVVAHAEYGLAAVAFRQGDAAVFRKAAGAILDASPRASTAPALIYALTGLAVDAREWPAALATAKRLVTEFPDDARSDDAIERVGAAAAKEKAWPVVYEAYTLLRQKYPASPFVADSRVAFGEAQLETGRADDGRRTLEQYFATSPSDPRATQARITLGRAREVTGDRPGALAAYTEAARSIPPSQWTKDTVLGYARLLTQAKRYDEAKGLLEPFVKAAPAPVAAEGALLLGEAFQGQGDDASAIEYFMTAAYVAPESTAGRRALLAAGRAFAAQKQPAAATTVYRKLLDQANVPADLTSAARRGLSELPR